MADERPSSPTRGWTFLRAGGKGPSDLGIPTKPVGINAPAGPVRVALGDKGEARLLLPLAQDEDPSSIVGAPALEITVIVLDEHLKTRRFLDLTCGVSELEVVFAEVVDQIIERISAGVSCTNAVRSTIDEFRALLTSRARSDAPREKMAGLIGELILLKELLDRSSDGWKAWRGPEGARHDFVTGSVAFEVKVTMKKGKGTITVNGLEQLCEPTGGNLYLQHYELEAAANGPLSIGSLASAILTRASDPERVTALIGAAGCASVYDIAWNSMSFRLEGDRTYIVDDGFPRIIGSSFVDGKAPASVSALTYCVDLGLASSNLLDHASASAAKERLIP
jgi:hypothetical protein